MIFITVLFTENQYIKKKYKRTKIFDLIVSIFIKRLRFLTGRIRILPDFLIIGAQKSGTTTLYYNLIKHPYIKPPFTKEIKFFTRKFKFAINWYRGFFPSKAYKFIIKKFNKKGFITGESTPHYIIYPHTPKRIYSILPNVKLIILVRNPVYRTFSHYHHTLRNGSRGGIENLSFEMAISKEEKRLSGEFEKMIEDENYYSYNYWVFSYLKRSIYIDQINSWLKYFTKKQILIIKTEDLHDKPKETLKEVFSFLNIPNYKINFKSFNVANYHNSHKINEKTKEYLIKYFKPHNQCLYEFLGKNLNWEKE